jgi:hypothetical protein
MAQMTVARNKWARFLEEFSRSHSGVMADIDVEERGRRRAMSLDRVFLRASLEASESGAPRAVITFKETPDQEDRHAIAAVSSLSLGKEGVEGQEALRFETLNGRATILRFPTASKPLAGGQSTWKISVRRIVKS